MRGLTADEVSAMRSVLIAPSRRSRWPAEQPVALRPQMVNGAPCSEEANTMNDNKPRERFQTRVTPVDRGLAVRQWSEWLSTRRSLLKYSGFAAGALALSGTSLLSRPSPTAAQ